MLNMTIGILLVVMAIFLVIAVLMQSSKDHRLGSSIAGGAETFFGKQKGKSMDALFNKLTTVIAIVFVLLVVILYVMQPETDLGTQIIEIPEVEDAADVADDAEEAPAVEGETAEGEVVVEAEIVETDTVAENEVEAIEPKDNVVVEFLGESWVELKGKNKVYFQGVFHKGDKKEIDYVENLFISVGRPYNVKVLVKGVEKNIVAKRRKMNIPLDSL
jgi:preprotein translocase subunit SecG